jgi:pectin methylesterase-like acyl-CoA thioesterase
MNSKILSVSLATIIVLSLVAFPLTIIPVRADPGIIYVPDDYPTIQDAIDAAEDNDTIIVRDGNYRENIEVNKRLTIRSENGSDSTIVHAADSDDHVFEVTADYVTISGFAAKGAINLFNL